MISACSARLLSYSSGLRLQLLISTQFNEKECLTWGNSLKTLAETDTSVPDIKPILNRLLVEPDFALIDLRHNAIVSGIVGYTSAVEYYLQDIIELSLRRSSRLRKKGLSGIQISAIQLENYDETKYIKSQLIKSIASENSKGQLFSNKLKKALSFLSLNNSLIDESISKSLDSIWLLRNQFAHMNQSQIDSYRINTNKAEHILLRSMTNEDYIKFIFTLVEIIDDSNNQILILDQKAIEVWEADKFE